MHVSFGGKGLTANITLQLHGILAHLASFRASFTLVKNSLEVLDFKASLQNLELKQQTVKYCWITYMYCMQ